ncbi:MAG: hypothetical protein ACYTCU_08525 [Planctomycetota bacterium]|jgi:hypothetical protein
MNDIGVFLTGLGNTLVITLGVVAYLRPHLRRILVGLCGTESRADFWTAFSNVTLILVPLVAALFRRPELDDQSAVFFEISAQLKSALIGLIAAVVLLGLVISRFIPRDSNQSGARPTSMPVPKPHGDPAGG